MAQALEILRKLIKECGERIFWQNDNRENNEGIRAAPLISIINSTSKTDLSKIEF
jgi:hypothetical protein